MSNFYAVGSLAGKLISTAKNAQDKSDALNLGRTYSNRITRKLGYSPKDILKRAEIVSLRFIDCAINNCNDYMGNGKDLKELKEKENLSQLAKYAGYLKLAMASCLLREAYCMDYNSPNGYVNAEFINKTIKSAEDMFNVAGYKPGLLKVDQIKTVLTPRIQKTAYSPAKPELDPKNIQSR